MNAILTVFGRGQVTLPKSMRDKYKTKYFLAREVEGGILIQPISVDENVVLNETEKDISLSFNPPINAKKLLKKLKEADGAL